MLMFQVSYERFLDEIRNEKIQPGDKNQLELEDLGKILVYYLTSLDRKIAFVFVVEKSEITIQQKINLNGISKPSIRIRDSIELTTISKSLEKIEESLRNPLKQRRD